MALHVYSPLTIVSQAEKQRVFIDPEGTFQSVGEWVLETDGTSLLKIMRYGPVHANFIWNLWCIIGSRSMLGWKI